jgi:excisionase family DNA binding protein
MPPVFVDSRELAERLGVTYPTLLEWVRRGRIPHIRDGRRRLLFNLTAVYDHLRKQEPRREPTGQGVAE